MSRRALGTDGSQERSVCAPCHPALAHWNDGLSLSAPRLGPFPIGADDAPDIFHPTRLFLTVSACASGPHVADMPQWMGGHLRACLHVREYNIGTPTDVSS